MTASGLVFVGIAPHPPIMVPEVGREHVAQVEGSVAAMREFARRIIANRAETVVIVSPHAPLQPDAFVVYADQQVQGDFAAFRAPQAEVRALTDRALLRAVQEVAAERGYRIVPLRGYRLDHGTAVPLYFLQRNGWRGRVVALGYTFLSNDDHMRFGECLRRAAEKVRRRVALVASGDLSHRLKPDAPAGYHPQARLFDEEITASIRTCALERIPDMDPNLRRIAGECGYRSMLVSIGASRDLPRKCELLHYEAPFGVGYMVAQICSLSSDDGEEHGEK
ncbi:AmmeMemoRadiSam system protein B [Pyrinomonas sp.]|uniref:AmmeMemoRadiSam system protein B n=1 Tax=Pyrinomonas sp. TaxID=2080306 RepID=UPI003325ACFD